MIIFLVVDFIVSAIVYTILEIKIRARYFKDLNSLKKQETPSFITITGNDAIKVLHSKKRQNTRDDDINTASICLIDIFEEFLDRKGIQIKNDDREGEPDEAIIFGEDYYYLEDRVKENLKQYM